MTIKYPFYDKRPLGPLLNGYLRKGNPFGLSFHEFQTLQAMHRLEVEPIIRRELGFGSIIIAEDYTGTGIAWGIGTGVSKEYLLLINSHLLKPDVAVLLDGERFLSGK